MTEAQKELLTRKQNEKAEIVRRLAEIRNAPNGFVAWAMAARDKAKPADIAIRINGVVGEMGEVVPRGFPAVLSRPEPSYQIDPAGSGRLELANWLTRQDNPLTARVMVNRIWLHLFGEGIVGSVDNFGMLGEKPTHPELLDWLALRFVQEGWSVKKMIRLLVSSRVYRMSSEAIPEKLAVDADNKLLWRMRPRRLEAEPLRDAILAVSGQLDLNPPPRGSVVAEMGDGCLERQVKTAPLGQPYPWRSVYLPAVRFYAPAVFRAFDGAPSTLSVGQREATNVPSQSLFLLNNEFVIEQARRAAGEILKSAADTEEALSAELSRFFEYALGRSPDEEEQKWAMALVISITQSKDRESAVLSFCQALFNTAEFRYIY